jgi:hypothetical protein
MPAKVLLPWLPTPSGSVGMNGAHMTNSATHARDSVADDHPTAPRVAALTHARWFARESTADEDVAGPGPPLVE